MADQVEPNDVSKMALYSLARADACMSRLADKDPWLPGDTASFDCMHYLGDEALCHAVTQLDLASVTAPRVLDVGSGFGGTGRYLHAKHHAMVLGIELQEEIDARAKHINRMNHMDGFVRSVNTDILDLPNEHGDFHFIVSFLCILHIPKVQRAPLFSKLHSLLFAGGKIYIEDYYALAPIDPANAKALRDVVSCPYLPSREEYLEHLTAAGFTDVVFKDVTPLWTDFVQKRATSFKATQGFDADLAQFYDTVATLFSDGNVGGVRITCTRSIHDTSPEA